MNIFNILPAVLLASLFFLSTGLAGVSFGYAAEICVIVLFIVLLLGAKANIRRLLSVLMNGNQPVLFSLTAYLLMDFFNFWVLGSRALAWQKYRVTAVLMLVFIALMVLHLHTQICMRVLLAVGYSAIVVTVCTLARYFLPLNLPLYYIARFSLRSDYNMYATLLLTGLICLVFGAIKLKENLPAAILLLTVPTIIAVTVLSGSRRVLIMLPVVLPVLAGALIIAGWQRFGVKKIVFVLLAIVLLAGLSYAETVFLKRQLTSLHKVQGQTRSVIQPPGGETTLVERYETIHSGSILEKRKVIWRVALREISKFSAKALIFGKGGGENILLYDAITEPIDAIYPDREARRGTLSAHNMLLADLIDGGLIKLVALLWLIATVIYCCLVLGVKKAEVGFPIGMVLAICLINSLVSNRFGLVYDRFFLFFSALAAIEYNKLKQKTDTNIK